MGLRYMQEMEDRKRKKERGRCEGGMGVMGARICQTSRRILVAVVIGVLAVGLAGCSASGSAGTEKGIEGSGEDKAADGKSGEVSGSEGGTADSKNSEAPGSEGGGQETSGKTGGQSAASGHGMTSEYKDSDLDASWDEDNSTVITCSGGQAEIDGDGAEVVSEAEMAAGDKAAFATIVIREAGTYVLRGSYTGQIQVDAGKEDKVQLVLDGFDGTNETSAVINGIQSDKIILTLADGTENTVKDGSSYVYSSDEEDEPDAAIFSKDDITVNGGGSLAVEGNYKHGIKTKNDLKIISGVITVTAAEDAIKGKDSVSVKDGTVTVKSGEDGIKSNEDADEDKGYVIIDGGVISIAAGDDGIHAETYLTVNGGTIDVTESHEGLEGRKVDINSGTIRIKSSDDGINAAYGGTDEGSGDSQGNGQDSQENGRGKMQADPDTYVRIAGGDVTVDASADGIDSNGDFYMDGGNVLISGPVDNGDGALDYNGTALISGGTIAVAGRAGMMQAFSEESSQAMILVYYESKQEAGTKIQLTDGGGTELLSWQPEKAWECVLISMPELEDGGTYGLTAGSDSQDITLDGILTQIGGQAGGALGGRGMGGGRIGGGKPGGEMPGDGSRPEGDRMRGGGNRPTGEMPEDGTGPENGASANKDTK